MAGPDEEIHIRDIEATGASKEGVGRWVLILSTVLVILLLGGVALWGGMSQGLVEEEATVSGKIQSVEGGNESNDGVLLGEDGSARDIGDNSTAGETLDTVPNTREQN